MKICQNSLCEAEFEGESLFCSNECFLEDASASLEEEQKVTKADIERLARMVKINEVEATKINLQSGDTLMVTVKHDDVSPENLQNLRKQLSGLFPNNRVMAFNVTTDGDIKFAVVSEPKVSYCSDCNCGKKAAAQMGENE